MTKHYAPLRMVDVVTFTMNAALTASTVCNRKTALHTAKQRLQGSPAVLHSEEMGPCSFPGHP